MMLPFEGGGVKDLHRREANRLIIGIPATKEIVAPLVLDKGMTMSWLRLIARGSVGGGHGKLKGGAETQIVTDTSLVHCTYSSTYTVESYSSARQGQMRSVLD